VKIFIWSMAVACVSAFPAARAQETPPLQFVAEYLREFGAIEHIRLAEERELQAPHQSMLAYLCRQWQSIPSGDHSTDGSRCVA